MELRHPEPPQQSLSAARSALNELVEAGRFNTPSRTSISAAELALSRPLQVVVLGLEDLRAGRGLESARPIGWRYLVEEGGRPVALAETVIDVEGRHVLGHVNYGPFVTGTDEALRSVQAIPDTAVAAPSLLHVPALYFLSLWLRGSDSPAQDSLVPIAPLMLPLEANRAYAASEVLQLLGERARRESDGPRDTR
jgi:hypothetical protein